MLSGFHDDDVESGYAWDVDRTFNTAWLHVKTIKTFPLRWHTSSLISWLHLNFVAAFIKSKSELVNLSSCFVSASVSTFQLMKIKFLFEFNYFQSFPRC